MEQYTLKNMNRVYDIVYITCMRIAVYLMTQEPSSHLRCLEMTSSWSAASGRGNLRHHAVHPLRRASQRVGFPPSSAMMCIHPNNKWQYMAIELPNRPFSNKINPVSWMISSKQHHIQVRHDTLQGREHRVLRHGGLHGFLPPGGRHQGQATLGSQWWKSMERCFKLLGVIIVIRYIINDSNCREIS